MTSYRKKSSSCCCCYSPSCWHYWNSNGHSHVPHRAMLQLGCRLRRAHDVTAQRDSHSA